MEVDPTVDDATGASASAASSVPQPRQVASQIVTVGGEAARSLNGATPDRGNAAGTADYYDKDDFA